MKRAGASRPARRAATPRAAGGATPRREGRRHPVEAYVALGSNLEDPARQVLTGLSSLAALPATRLVANSSLYRTAPVGYRDQPDFVNAVALLRTTLEPRSLLDALTDDHQPSPRGIQLDFLHLDSRHLRILPMLVGMPAEGLHRLRQSGDHDVPQSELLGRLQHAGVTETGVRAK